MNEQMKDEMSNQRGAMNAFALQLWTFVDPHYNNIQLASLLNVASGTFRYLP